MITDQQVRRLRMLRKQGKTIEQAALKTDMNRKTAQKYIQADSLPSENKKDHTWATRPDPFKEVWEEIKPMLELNPGLEAKTIFQDLQRKTPGRFQDGQLRSLQRKIKRWRVLEGPSQEVYFEQEHHPGELGASDYTDMNEIGVTIRKEFFAHKFFHFTLTYSNWETGKVCFSESFESHSEGLQAAWWELGGVPQKHRTDNMSAAVNKDCNPEVFTDRYRALLNYYRVEGTKIQPRKAHENGDIEQRNYRFKEAVSQALMLRGSYDFDSREEYEKFLGALCRQLNTGRDKKFREELPKLKALPSRKLETSREIEVRVSGGSTIVISGNIYSVNSRLRGVKVRVRVHAERLDVLYGGKTVEEFPRIRGNKGHRIDYRHIIDSLVKKPGAFENYRYRDDMFPTSRFRMTYDQFRTENILTASKRYLEVLYLAAKEGEEKVDAVLREVFARGTCVKLEGLLAGLGNKKDIKRPHDVVVKDVDLRDYDMLLRTQIGVTEAVHE